MHVSYNGRCFIAKHEACVLVAYPDGHHFSIGFGHNNPELTNESEITILEAFKLFKDDLIPREEAIAKLVKVPMLQHEFDTFVSVYYQAGNQVRRPIAFFNNGDRMEAMAELMAINRDYSKREFKPGLVKRRFNEMQLFLHGDYGDLTKMKLWKSDPSKTNYIEVPFPEESLIG